MQMKYFNNPIKILNQTNAIDRFIRYIKIDTTSNPDSKSWPSSPNQLILGKMLVTELKELGLSNAAIDSNGYVTATLTGTHGNSTIGLLAHLDTSNACSGTNITPLFHKNYTGDPIFLKNNVIINPAQDPALSKCTGHTIITADGTTLLGADDKAGIAIIMSVLVYFKLHPELPHPTIRVGFTPDEEIGNGATRFPVSSFGADVAFTIDGSDVGEINLETFEAWSVKITIKGVSTHPGTAKDKMVNALRHMANFITRLPGHLSPETTSNREGFIHPLQISGDASECTCHLIIRDFNTEQAKKMCRLVETLASDLKKEEPRLTISTDNTFSYPNMNKFLQQKPEIKTKLINAIKKADISPVIKPIRGGTDGAILSQKGLPTPNIFTGANNFHGPTEWISTKNMGLSICTVLNLLTEYAIDSNSN
jgi:tripeptide aminopeptidase